MMNGFSEDYNLDLQNDCNVADTKKRMQEVLDTCSDNSLRQKIVDGLRV